MAPGITYLPAASMVSSAVTPLAARPPPICAIVSPSTRTSASYEPSAVTTVPLAIRVRMLPPRAWPAAWRQAGGGPLGGHRSEAERAERVVRPAAETRGPHCCRSVRPRPVAVRGGEKITEAEPRVQQRRRRRPASTRRTRRRRPRRSRPRTRRLETNRSRRRLARAAGPSISQNGSRRWNRDNVDIEHLQHLAVWAFGAGAVESDLRPPDPRPDRTGPHRTALHRPGPPMTGTEGWCAHAPRSPSPTRPGAACRVASCRRRRPTCAGGRPDEPKVAAGRARGRPVHHGPRPVGDERLDQPAGRRVRHDGHRRSRPSSPSTASSWRC